MQNVIFANVFKLTSAQEYSRVQGRTQDFISGGAGAYGERVSTSDVSPWPWPWSLRPKYKSLALALALALWPKSLALVLALRVVLGLGLDP